MSLWIIGWLMFWIFLVDLSKSRDSFINHLQWQGIPLIDLCNVAIYRKMFNFFTAIVFYHHYQFLYISFNSIQQTSQSPHPMNVASSMYDAICRTAESQCCVVSGETCSGKTEIGRKVLNGLLRLLKTEKSDIASKITMVKFPIII